MYVRSPCAFYSICKQWLSVDAEQAGAGRASAAEGGRVNGCTLAAETGNRDAVGVVPCEERDLERQVRGEASEGMSASRRIDVQEVLTWFGGRAYWPLGGDCCEPGEGAHCCCCCCCDGGGGCC